MLTDIQTTAYYHGKPVAVHRKGTSRIVSIHIHKDGFVAIYGYRRGERPTYLLQWMPESPIDVKTQFERFKQFIW